MACANLDRDQTFIVQDFGPTGYVGNVTINLTQGLQPGAVFGAVILSNHHLIVNVYDVNKNALLSFGARIFQNNVACNSLIDGKWGTEIKLDKSPWVQGVRASFSFLYDVDGYKMFVNGVPVLSMEHRSTARPHQVEITGGQVFKVIYHTTMNIIP